MRKSLSRLSGPFDESFTECHLKPGSVLDFGCSPGLFTSRLARRPELKITGIDLYPAARTDGYRFIRSDILALDLEERFDNICCVSSWEHCGIETRDYLPGGTPDLNYHLRVASKLKQLLVPSGRLIITCPLGPDEVWLTYDGLPDAKIGDARSRIITPKWGYRTTRVATLEKMFAPLRLTVCVAKEHMLGDYFSLDNWIGIDPKQDHHYTSPSRRAVVGAVFELGE